MNINYQYYNLFQIQNVKNRKELSKDNSVVQKSAVLSQRNSNYSSLNIFTMSSALYPVSFGSNSLLLNKFNKVPCPCCGNIMLTSNDVNRFIEYARKATGLNLIKHLKNYRNKLPKREKEVCDLLIKYAKNNSDQTIDKLLQSSNQLYKNPDELLKMLIKPLKASKEHIIPVSKEGKDSIWNYLSECIRCNSERKNIPYIEWIKIHPEMIENSQKYIDIIIHKIIKYEQYSGDFHYTDYPAKIKQLLQTETNNKIILDISKMNEYIKNKDINQIAISQDNLYY